MYSSIISLMNAQRSANISPFSFIVPSPCLSMISSYPVLFAPIFALKYSISIVVSCHVMSCHVMSCHVMSCHVMSCHVMSCHVMSCHVMSCHVMSCHLFLLCFVMSFSFILSSTVCCKRSPLFLHPSHLLVRTTV